MKTIKILTIGLVASLFYIYILKKLMYGELQILTLSCFIVEVLAFACICFLYDAPKSKIANIVKFCLNFTAFLGLATISSVRIFMILNPYVIILLLLVFVSGFYLFLKNHTDNDQDSFQRQVMLLMTKSLYVVAILVFIIAIIYSLNPENDLFTKEKYIIHDKRLPNEEYVNNGDEEYVFPFSEEDNMENNMEILSSLMDDEWRKFDQVELMKLLHTVTNIESRYLGLPKRLSVKIVKLQDDVIANFSEVESLIRINETFILDEQTTGCDLIEAISHEVRHAWQHQIASLYQSMTEQQRKLRTIDNFYQIYSEMCEDYKRFEDPEQYYYSAVVEQDARKYAEESVLEYKERIYNYTSYK